MNWPIRRVVSRLLFICALFSTHPALAQLSVDVEVDVTESDGLFTYQYTVNNSILSSASINLFLLDIVDGHNVVLGDIADVTDDGMGEPLFHDGKPGEVIRRMASFSAAFSFSRSRTIRCTRATSPM